MFGIKIKFEKAPKEEKEADVSEGSILGAPEAALSEEDIARESEIMAEQEKAGAIWQKISQWALYALIFLTPIFLLPWGILPVAQNKQFLALVLVAIAFIAWLAKSIASGRLVWAKTLINVAVLALLIVWALSAFFSMSKFRSLGFVGAEPDNLVNILTYILAFFLVSANLQTKKDLQKAILAFLASLALVAIFTGLKFMGVNILPWDFAKPVEFNTIGEIGSLALFFGFGLTMIIGLMLVDGIGAFFEGSGEESKEAKYRKPFQAGIIALAIILSAELLLINFKNGWWALAGVMLFLVAYGFTREVHEVKAGKKKIFKIQRLALPIVVLVFSVVIILANAYLQNGLPSNKLIQLPVEFSLSNSASYDIAKNVLSHGGNSVIGSGPATFTYDYGLYKPQDINKSIFWGVRFAQGSNFFLNNLSTVGILGILSLLFLLFAFAWQALKTFSLKGLSREGGETSLQSIQNKFQIPVLSATLFLLISWFLYSSNFVLMMTSFMGLALLIASRGFELSQKNAELRGINPEETAGEKGEIVMAKKGQREISLLISPQRTLIVSLVLIILMVGAVSLLYLESQKYIASLYFSSGVADFNKTGNVDVALDKINKAIGLDVSSDQYVRTASQGYLVQTNNILNSPKWQGATSAVQDDLRSQFQTNMAQAVEYAKRAADLEPVESLNWSNLGFVYENILPFAAGAEKFMIDAYQKAAALEPKNPALEVDLGRAHVLVSDRILNQMNQIASGKNPDKSQIEALNTTRNQELAAAIAELQKAVDLKNDYSPAHFLLVQAYGRQGDLKNAIAKSIDYYSLNPKDPGAAFQLGFLYYKDNQMDNARLALEVAVNQSSDYSNARYFLGLIYDSQGNKAAAKEQFEKILALNADNQEVKKILENLNAGRPALETIVPPAPAPQDRTQTPVKETGGAQNQQPLSP